MINIASYTKSVWLILAEGGKYFALLVFCILAIRLWRRWARFPAARNAGGLLSAGVATVLAAVIGFLAIRQSLSSVDSYY